VIGSAERAPRPSAFAALVALAGAVEQRRPDDLVAALSAVPQPLLLRAAARHRCLGYIRRGIADLRVRSAPATAIADALREYSAKAGLQTYVAREQIERLARDLNQAAIPFALLKGAARIFRSERGAALEMTDDLDLLVPRRDGNRAVALLERRGYRSELGEQVAAYYERHHHLAPLVPLELGLPVELHVGLAPLGSLSMATDWSACEPYFERVTVGDVETICFNPLGTAIHLTIHSEGIKRFRDVILLSRILRDDEAMYGKVQRLVERERCQLNALQAVLALSAHLAGIDVEASLPARRYLQWVMRREDLQPSIRDRCQLADAWYSSGGRLLWPATRHALLPDALEERRNAPVAALRSTLRAVGRICASAYAVLGFWKVPSAP